MSLLFVLIVGVLGRRALAGALSGLARRSSPQDLVTRRLRSGDG